MLSFQQGEGPRVLLEPRSQDRVKQKGGVLW